MRKIVVASIAALGATGFAVAAQADCAGAAHTTASTAMPIVTAENAKAPAQTVIPTKTTPTQNAKATKTEKSN